MGKKKNTEVTITGQTHVEIQEIELSTEENLVELDDKAIENLKTMAEQPGSEQTEVIEPEPASEPEPEQPVIDNREKKYIHYDHFFDDEEMARMYKKSLDIAQKIGSKEFDLETYKEKIKADIKELAVERKDIDDKARVGYEDRYEQVYVEYDYINLKVRYFNMKSGKVVKEEKLPPQGTIFQMIPQNQPKPEPVQEPEQMTEPDESDKDLSDFDPDKVDFFNTLIEGIDPWEFPEGLDYDTLVWKRFLILADEKFDEMYVNHISGMKEILIPDFFALAQQIITKEVAA
jgi:hypothetical protein